ncbi:MAG: DUF1648 domain-containing protein [Traorella sp.]
MNEKKFNYLSSLLCLFPILIGLYFYHVLPDKIAIHFNIHNQPDSYFPKPLFVFGMPIMMLILHQFVLYRDSQQDENDKRANRKMSLVSKCVIPSITLIMYCLTIYYALKANLDVRLWVMIIIGVLLIVVGNYLPKTKSNRMVHIGFTNKLNDQDYRKLTHSSGYILILNGLMCMVSIFFDSIWSVCVVVLIIFEALILTIITYIKGK